MQTSIDAAPRRRYRWVRWLAPLVVLAAVAVAVLVRVAGGSDASGASAADPERPLPEQLAARVVAVLEESSLSEHTEHGHHFDEETVGVVCGAETLGYDPPDATTMDEVEVVYARHMCAEVGTGYGWPEAVRAAGPLAVELTTDPPTVLLPEQALPDQPDAPYADRIQAIIPEQYQDQALDSSGFSDPAVSDALRQRFEEASD